METMIFSADPRDLKQAAELLKSGKRVVFPTETVYGLGANAQDPVAVKSIFEAKGRPSDNPLIVHISSLSQIEEIAEDFPPKARLLAEKFMPGPLTIILKKKSCIPPEVTAGLDTVGIRMPQNPVAKEFLTLCGVPVAAPSANISGRPSPTDAKYVTEDMMGRVEGIIDGGDCTVGVESTVIDMTGEVPVILRPGGVTAEEISAVLGEVIGGREKADMAETPKAPGMKYTHYAPSAPVRILKGTVGEIEAFMSRRGKTSGILTFDELPLDCDCIKISLGSKGDPRECARRLFRALRDMDSLGATEIYAPEIPDTGLWSAVKNRLYKSAGGRIIRATDREIVFVCTGNTCRSPMAEGIFASLPNKGYFASSAGIFAQDKAEPSENSVKAMGEIGIDIKSHRSRQLTPQIIERAEMLVTMTQSHKDALSAFGNKALTLGELAGTNASISDPFGGDLKVYRACRDEISGLVKKAYDKL